MASLMRAPALIVFGLDINTNFAERVVHWNKLLPCNGGGCCKRLVLSTYTGDSDIDAVEPAPYTAAYQAVLGMAEEYKGVLWSLYRLEDTARDSKSSHRSE